jgi:hypothetical protein
MVEFMGLSLEETSTYRAMFEEKFIKSETNTINSREMDVVNSCKSTRRLYLVHSPSRMSEMTPRALLLAPYTGRRTSRRGIDRAFREGAPGEPRALSVLQIEAVRRRSMALRQIQTRAGWSGYTDGKDTAASCVSYLCSRELVT